ncbi:hypothetical protein [Methanosarcina sp. DH2]|nr:hypothetical protein [Methanosarcina sp. DH2]
MNQFVPAGTYFFLRIKGDTTEKSRVGADSIMYGTDYLFSE